MRTGKGQWFAGTVAADNGDGTFAVLYDDGDRDERARPEHIRVLAPLEVGAVVEIKFKGSFLGGKTVGSF